MVGRAAWPAITSSFFGDIEGKLATLRVECKRCGRAGRYSVARLIEKHGRKGNLTVWLHDLKGDWSDAGRTGLSGSLRYRRA